MPALPNAACGRVAACVEGAGVTRPCCACVAEQSAGCGFADRRWRWQGSRQGAGPGRRAAATDAHAPWGVECTAHAGAWRYAWQHNAYVEVVLLVQAHGGVNKGAAIGGDAGGARAVPPPLVLPKSGICRHGGRAGSMELGIAMCECVCTAALVCHNLKQRLGPFLALRGKYKWM